MASRDFLRTAVLGLILLLFACSTVPVTGRRSLNILPDSQLASLSLQQYTDVLKNSKLSNDPVKIQTVKRVGERIARATEEFFRENRMEGEIQNYKWEFNVIDDDKVINAWCMPGGKVAVYTGIFPIAQDDTGLAVVMGHEIAHAIAKHGNERMSQGLLAQVGAVGLQAALSSHPAETTQIFTAAYGLGANYGLILPYSRLQESEADHIGLILMAKAGYDPRKAVPFWERMNKSGGGRQPEFLSTHPAPETRIKQIESEVPEAMKFYKGS